LTKARLKITGTIVLLLLITAASIAAVTYGAGLLWGTIKPESTATSTPTATLTPGQTAAATETVMATQTLMSTLTPTPTPTDTSMPTSTPSAISTHTASPTPSDTPTVTRTRSPTATPTPKRPTSTPEPAYPAPTLLKPDAGAELAGVQRFTWQWNAPPLEENYAFDLRIWSLQEEHEERPRRGAAALTQDTQAEAELSYVPAIADYGPGDYYWTVVVVKAGAGGVSRVVGEWGEKRRFTYGGPSGPTSPAATQPAPTSPAPTTPAPTPVPPTPTPAPWPTSMP
jgi:hypothetical protein